MHKKITGLLTTAVLATLSASAFADDGKWSVGASVLYQEQAYRGTKTSDKFMPVPMVNYEGKNFYFHTLATGYYLWNDKKDQLSVDLFYYPQAYRDDTYEVGMMLKRNFLMVNIRLLSSYSKMITMIML